MTTQIRPAAWWALGAAAAALVVACSSPGSDNASDSDEEESILARFAMFEPVELSGEGDGIVDLPEGVTQAMVTASHDGEHYFSISGLDSNNEATADLLVNTTGAYEGVAALGVNDNGTVRLEVTADGAWTITLAPLADAPALPESGAGDGVFTYEGAADTWAVTHSGEHYFSLSLYDEPDSIGLLATEVGAYDGEVAVSGGPALVVVSADGEWTITPK